MHEQTAHFFGDVSVELLHLKYFQKLAEYEHVTRAAESLCIAQSSLSRTLRGLEGELGVTLFDRQGKNISLNDNGRLVLKYANSILGQLEDMKRELKDKNSLTGKETIVLLVRVASKFLPEIISGFRREHPQVSFVIIQNESALQQGKKHWNLCLDATIEPVTEDENISCVLKEEVCLAMPKGHHLAAREAVALEEVAQESFIGLQKGSSMNDIAESYCRKAGFQPNIILESDNPATLRGLMRVGLGIAFNPVVTWKEMSDEDIRLVAIKGGCCRYINVELCRWTYPSRTVLAFRKYLVGFFHALGKR